MDTTKKVLVVEDDKFLAMAYKAKLTKAGFAITMAGDGEVAIQELSKAKPDLILLDLILPKKDGFTALGEIKANADWKDIPVIIASNLGQKEDIDRAMSLGAVDFITKADVSLDEIVNKINAQILKHQTQKA